MKSVEITANSFEEALEQALEELGLDKAKSKQKK